MGAARGPGGPFLCNHCGLVHFGACREEERTNMLRNGQRIFNSRTERYAVVLDAHERCPYTGTLLARCQYEDFDVTFTLVNPGWMPTGWAVA